MPFINLIQEQRLAKRRQQRQARSAFFALVAAGVAGVGGFGFCLFERERLGAEESRLKAEIQKMAPLLAKIDADMAQIDGLKPRLDTLEDAEKMTDRWNRILAHLTTQTPKGTWLTGLRSIGVESDKPIQLTLNGTSEAQEPIGNFILRVENEPDLDNVNLHFTQEKIDTTGKAIDFEVAADVQGTAPKKVQEDKSGSEAKS